MSRRQGKVLMVDDELELLRLSSSILSREGHTVKTAPTADEALRLLEKEEFDVILLDLKMPGMSGLEFLEHFKPKARREEVVILTAYADVESAVKATKLGAYGYVAKPFNADAVLTEIDKILEVQHLRAENSVLRERQMGLDCLVGKHEKIHRLRQLIRDVAPTPLSVLILGETGTGKELVAHMIHYTSDRADKPFVRCNCAAFAQGVLESELFGHIKGAFTGAVKDRKGRFAEADGGTLFLDEIGDLDLDTQIRLLRVLQEQEFEPVGSTQTQRVDVRIITATHQNLEEAIQRGRFRGDLFYRIKGMVIELPPLRMRKGDIPILCAHIVARHNETLQKVVKGLSAEALQVLIAHDWPGNVRELENVLMGAMALARGEEIEKGQVLMAMQRADEQVAQAEEVAPYPVPSELFHEARKQFEILFISRILRETRGNISQAAELMHLGRSNLQRKIKGYRIDVAEFEEEV
ncbi:MAG: sigma-54-dependent Fis family transcriptional regulator [Candidatus Latescibacteria bacterium]|nr:sigma-54-dependent Fis family transcriptional regulator [Candidatus Latescibacterota bacterium]